MQAIFWFHMEDGESGRKERETARGLGHARRCLALARVWKQETGHAATLMINRSDAAEEFAVTASQSWCFEDDAGGLFKDQQPVILFADINYLEAETLRKYSRMAVTVNLAPRGSAKYAAHLNFLDTWADVDDAALKNANCELFAGPKYSVVSDEFIDVRRGIDLGDAPWKEKLITISMGGVDPWNFTLLAIGALEGLPDDYEVQVILGPGYAFEEELQKAISKSGQDIMISREPDSFANLLSQSTVAILGGGITVLESLTLGIPSWNICPTPFHLKRCHEWQRDGVVQGARLDEEITPGCWTERIRAFCEDGVAITAARKSALAYIDGCGAARIVEAVHNHALQVMPKT